MREKLPLRPTSAAKSATERCPRHPLVTRGARRVSCTPGLEGGAPPPVRLPRSTSVTHARWQSVAW